MNCLPTLVICLAAVLSLQDVSAYVKHQKKDAHHYTRPDFKISGGEMSKPGEFPYLVSIQLSANPETEHGINGHHICGAILFNKDWAVSTASCVVDQKLEDLWIVPGEWDQRHTAGSEQMIVPDMYVFQPNYDRMSTPPKNNIVMIHLSESVEYTRYSQPAPMVNDTFKPTYNENCFEAGWGKTSDDSEELVHTFPVIAPVSLLDGSYCSSAYGAFEDNWLCAGNLQEEVGFCAGDNGGPLTCTQTGSDREIVAGLISYRDGCATPGKPGVYVELVHYAKWMLGISLSPQ